MILIFQIAITFYLFIQIRWNQRQYFCLDFTYLLNISNKLFQLSNFEIVQIHIQTFFDHIFLSIAPFPMIPTASDSYWSNLSVRTISVIFPTYNFDHSQITLLVHKELSYNILSFNAMLNYLYLLIRYFQSSNSSTTSLVSNFEPIKLFESSFDYIL